MGSNDWLMGYVKFGVWLMGNFLPLCSVMVSALYSNLAQRGSSVPWGKSISCHGQQGVLLINGMYTVHVWLSSTSDVCIKVDATDNNGTNASYRKVETNNTVSFGFTPTATDYTITRNGLDFTITTNAYSAFTWISA